MAPDKSGHATDRAGAKAKEVSPDPHSGLKAPAG
tara:strand:- start:39521 stop:39622 length:102 start_codon:yes stop_codon:yes gene_type:complete